MDDLYWVGEGRRVIGNYYTWREIDAICPFCGDMYVISTFPTDWMQPYIIPITTPAKTCGLYECNMAYIKWKTGYRLLRPNEATADWLKETDFSRRILELVDKLEASKHP